MALALTTALESTHSPSGHFDSLCPIGFASNPLSCVEKNVSTESDVSPSDKAKIPSLQFRYYAPNFASSAKEAIRVLCSENNYTFTIRGLFRIETRPQIRRSPSLVQLTADLARLTELNLLLNTGRMGKL